LLTILYLPALERRGFTEISMNTISVNTDCIHGVQCYSKYSQSNLNFQMIQSIQTNTIATLNPEDKLTLLIMNSMGITVIRHIRFNASKIERNGYYGKTAIVLKYKLKGMKNISGTRFDIEDVVIAKGWQLEHNSMDLGVECFNYDLMKKKSATLTDIVFSRS
jgi:hypothetical protein